MADRLRIVMGQLNFLVGDVYGNTKKIITAIETARDSLQADIIAFPELCLTAYPPEDLLLRPDLYPKIQECLDSICQATVDIDVILGYPVTENGDRYNAASVLRQQEILCTYYKQSLPNYAVFDESRYFLQGSEPGVTNIKGIKVGLTICEDLWSPQAIEQSVLAGAQIIINLNASPFHVNKAQEREGIAAIRAKQNNIPIIYVNQIGGQDELVFDGDSFAVRSDGSIFVRGKAFVEDLVIAEVEKKKSGLIYPHTGTIAANMDEEESIYNALVLGVRDYVEKNGFPGVVIGLSGGIDSALTLAIAVDAVGADQVEAVMMPSPYTAAMSIEDARLQAKALAISRLREISITEIFRQIQDSLKDEFGGLPADTTEENIQARIRGLLLMAISNKTGKLVLTTGNKSEMAVGYATLYGDMAGGFAVIKDVPKTMVYRLAKYRNNIKEVIPQRVLLREPSAELAPEQKDTDSLPPYSILDPIIERYVEHDESVAEIAQAGFDEATVQRVISLIDRNEYKRRQAAPGVRITPRAFGRDRRYPITSGYGRKP